MDIDAAGVVRRFAITFPIIISEPARLVRDGDEVPAPFMVQSEGLLLRTSVNVGDALGDPENSLPLASRKTSADMPPISFGSGPSKSFPEIRKSFNFFRLPTQDGRGPENLLPEISRYSRFVRVPNAEGSGPESSPL